MFRFYIYLNKYILSKIIFLFLLLVGTSTLLCILSNLQLLLRLKVVPVVLHKEAISSTSLDTLRECLYLSLILIIYIACKTELVLFSTNFITCTFAKRIRACRGYRFSLAVGTLSEVGFALYRYRKVPRLRHAERR